MRHTSNDNNNNNNCIFVALILIAILLKQTSDMSKRAVGTRNLIGACRKGANQIQITPNDDDNSNNDNNNNNDSGSVI